MLMLIAVVAALAQPISLDSLLKELVSRDTLARLPDPPYVCTQSSSYDRASISPDKPGWFANDDSRQFLRSENNAGRTEWVMLDQDGPGAIVRIWSANPAGVLRIYLDGANQPSIEAPMADVLGGKWKAPAALSYEAARGWNLYLPIPYSQHCKVTSDSKEFYYHVNARTYAPGTRVETYSTAALEAAAPTMEPVLKDLTADRTHGLPSFTAEERGMMQGRTAHPGESLTITLPEGPHALTGMMVSLKTADLAQATRSCIIRAEFDGERTIWCPVGDFFGSGVGLNQFQDFYRSAGEDGWMRCRWVMPYERTCTFTIENLSPDTVQIDFRARVKPWVWDERSMHFHAAWHHESPIHVLGGKGTSDFNYVDVSGKGVYVGDVLSVLNPVKEWWGEGDEKIYVDGETFPSHFGTGTEDYYGYAWCMPEVFHRAFHAQTRCDGQARNNNWGRTTVTRSRALDAIPFTKSLSMNIEAWHWRECNVEYASTAYFYARPGAATNRVPQMDAAKAKLIELPPLPPPLVIKGALEFEDMAPSAKSDEVVAVKQGGFAEVWSKDHQLWVQAHKVGDYVEFTIPAAKPAAVAVYATRSWDYATVRFTVNGKKAGEDLDLCSGVREVKATGRIALGTFEPLNGALTLRAEVVGASAKSEKPGTYFGLDCVVLEPAP